MSDFLQTISCLVGRQVNLRVLDSSQVDWLFPITAMLEDVDLAEETIKLECHDPIPARDVYAVEIVNPDFSKRADR